MVTYKENGYMISMNHSEWDCFEITERLVRGRYDTGLHGQIHGTAAGAWFPIQGTAQLIGAGIAGALGY